MVNLPGGWILQLLRSLSSHQLESLPASEASNLPDFSRAASLLAKPAARSRQEAGETAKQPAFGESLLNHGWLLAPGCWLLAAGCQQPD